MTPAASARAAMPAALVDVASFTKRFGTKSG